MAGKRSNLAEMKHAAFALLLLGVCACQKDFGKGGDDDDVGSGAEIPWATYCLKLRTCFGDPRPISACILVEASGTTNVSPFLRPPRVENGNAQELVQETSWWEQFLVSRHGCIERAATCDDAHLCGNGDGTTCTTEPRCRSGDNLSGCFGEGTDEYTYEVHCTQSTLDCLPNAETGAACGLEDCIVGPPDPVCDGDRASYCDNGGITTLDCGASAMMRGCGDGTPGGCKPRGEDCDPRTFVGACQGSAAEYCVDGQVKTIDCTTAGFTSCALVAGAPGCA